MCYWLFRLRSCACSVSGKHGGGRLGHGHGMHSCWAWAWYAFMLAMLAMLAINFGNVWTLARLIIFLYLAINFLFGCIGYNSTDHWIQFAGIGILWHLWVLFISRGAIALLCGWHATDFRACRGFSALFTTSIAAFIIFIVLECGMHVFTAVPMPKHFSERCAESAQ